MIKSDDRCLMAAAFRHGRKMNGISRADAVQALGVTLGDLGRIEGGRMPIPRDVFNSLMYHGIRARCKKDRSFYWKSGIKHV